MSLFLHNLMDEVAQYPAILVLLEILILIHFCIFVALCCVCSKDSCCYNTKYKFRQKYIDISQ